MWFEDMQDLGYHWLTCVTQDILCTCISTILSQSSHPHLTTEHANLVNYLHDLFIDNKLIIETPNGHELQQNLKYNNGSEWYLLLLQASREGLKSWQKEMHRQEGMNKRFWKKKETKFETVNTSINNKRNKTGKKCLVGAWMTKMMN